MHFLFFVLNKNYLWAEILKTRANIVNRKYHFLVICKVMVHTIKIELQKILQFPWRYHIIIPFIWSEMYMICHLNRYCSYYFWLLHNLNMDSKNLPWKTSVTKSWLNFCHVIYYGVKTMEIKHFVSKSRVVFVSSWLKFSHFEIQKRFSFKKSSLHKK